MKNNFTNKQAALFLAAAAIVGGSIVQSASAQYATQIRSRSNIGLSVNGQSVDVGSVGTDSGQRSSTRSSAWRARIDGRNCRLRCAHFHRFGATQHNTNQLARWFHTSACKWPASVA
jgi:hypothetical protein